jgi:hypothetical protein
MMDFMVSLLPECILRGIVSLSPNKIAATVPKSAAVPSRDFISLLPDCILGSIVSLLPPKAAARTAVLSRRWRYIWQSVPLDLAIGCRGSDLHTVDARQISLLLSSRRGPIRSIRAIIYAGEVKESYPIWVQALAGTHVDDTLTLKFPSHWVSVLVPFYRLAHSLRRLELDGCRLDMAMDGDETTTTTLPRLHSLCLSNVHVSEAALHRMLDSCTALLDLSLWRIHGLRRLVLRSGTLATVRIKPRVPMDELSFSDAPNLESIAFLYTDLWRVRAITQAAAAPPKLREVTLKVPLLLTETTASIQMVN